MSQPALITSAEVARILARPERTVKLHAKLGKLPVSQKLDGRTGAYLFDRAAIEALAQESAA